MAAKIINGQNSTSNTIPKNPINIPMDNGTNNFLSFFIYSSSNIFFLYKLRKSPILISSLIINSVPSSKDILSFIL